MGAAPEFERVQILREQLEERVRVDFTYHPPASADQVAVFDTIRRRARELATYLVERVPPGRELSRALSDLEDCVMHANAAVARHWPSIEQPAVAESLDAPEDGWDGDV